MAKLNLKKIAPLFGLVLLIIALAVLHHELRKYHWREILHEMNQMRRSQIWFALLFTFLGYFSLTGYDYLAFRYIKTHMSYLKTATASFVGYAFSNTVGFATLTGSAIRYRLYSSWGLSGFEITKIILFCSFSFWMGFLALSGALFLIHPFRIPEYLPGSLHYVPALGVGCLLLTCTYLSGTLLRKRPFIIKGVELPVPPFSLSLMQILISSLDWICAGATLYALLPTTPGFTFSEFLSIFLLAQLTAVVSHVPGGIGVFDSLVVFMLSDKIHASSILGALLAFRAIYYLLPFLLSVLTLGLLELSEGAKRLGEPMRRMGGWTQFSTPSIFSVSSFCAGAILIFTGVTPGKAVRLFALGDMIPLPLIESAHMLSAVSGLGLLFLSRGLLRRLKSAYRLSVLLLLFGVVSALVRALDIEVALVIGIILGVLLGGRKAFYRETSLKEERFSLTWGIAILSVIACSISLGLFTYKNYFYTHDVWIRFGLFGDGPRFLRASAIMLIAASGILLSQLLRPPRIRAHTPEKAELEQARKIIDFSRWTYAYLALARDKALLFSPNEQAFTMYAVTGSFYIAMGDPVGHHEETSELIWRFQEVADRVNRKPIFFSATEQYKQEYLDLGLNLARIGDDARVSLERDFPAVQRDDLAFSVLSPVEVASRLLEMRELNDRALQAGLQKEHGYFTGFFEPEYLLSSPVAILEKAGKLVGFGNVWLSAGREEAALDVFRVDPELFQQDSLNYFIRQLLHWSKEKGYRYFNLGLTPSEKSNDELLQPFTSKVGKDLFKFAEFFSDLEKLRNWKADFGSLWLPKYLAAPGGLEFPQAIASLARVLARVPRSHSIQD